MNHLECVTTMRNRWYWYLLVFFLSYMVANTIGVIPYVAVIAWSILRSGDVLSMHDLLSGGDLASLIEGIDSNLMLFAMLCVFAVMLVAAAYFIRMFQGRTWTQVVNGRRRMRWSHFFAGFGVWGVITVVTFVIAYVTDRENFEFRFDAARFIPLVLIAVTMIPIQSAAEEFFFRGYLAQGVASWTHSRWWVLVVPSVLFGLMHVANPEVAEYGFWVMIPQYIFMGAAFGLAALLDDGIEVSMGAHAANNLCGAVLTTYQGAALRTDALFTIRELDPANELPGMIAAGAIFVGVLAYLYKWKFGVMNSRVSPPVPVVMQGKA